MMQRFLKVPLGAKLAGANVLVALAALGASYAAFHDSAAEWRLVSVVTVALVYLFLPETRGKSLDETVLL